MSYSSLRACVNDLEKHGQLLRIKKEVDPNLEMAEIHRRIFEEGGPAILFEKVKGSPFQAVSNIYGTYERTDFIFRHTLEKVKRVIELKADPANFFKNPGRYLGAPFTALSALPMRSIGKAPVQWGETTIDQLPLIKSWPMDGGAFVTMPQVFTLPPGSKNIMQSNLGMYRIQLDGNDYVTNKEIGLHYQLHRGIGVHHTLYNETEEDFKCSIFIGGPPSHAFSAIMPLPEGLSELTFAGMLAGRRFRYTWQDGYVLSSDADFVITGTIRKGEKKPEGPFGDHLGYYSLTHDFPVMDVHKVYYRKDPLWHFSVVGRPPMEDSSFGYLIHKIVKLLILRSLVSAMTYSLSKMTVALPWRRPSEPPVPCASARSQFLTCTAGWASPRSWRTASRTLVRPPRLPGWLLHRPPPSVLNGSLPTPEIRLPSATSFPPLPFSAKPRSSSCISTVMVKLS